MKENGTSDNQMEPREPVQGFTPIDIFAPPPRKYRLAARRPPAGVYRRVRSAAPAPEPAPAPEARLSLAEEANALYLHAVGGYWVVFAAFTLLALALPRLLPDIAGPVSVVYQGVILALPPLRRAARSEALAEKMRLRRPPRGAGILALLFGLAAALAAPGLTGAWGWVLERLGARLTGAGLAAVSWSAVPMLLLRSALLAGICEELFFRGYLLSAWEDRRGRRCVAVTAALFALAHGGVQALPAHFAMGLMLGLICVRSGSVFCAMLAHAGYNAAAVLLAAAWTPAGPGQTVPVALCGAAICAAFYLLLVRVSHRKTVNIASGQQTGWQGALALYAAVITALLPYAWELARMFG